MNQFTVAICDDNAKAAGIISTSVKTIFAKRGISAETECFLEPFSLQDRMRKKQFDLLLLDINLVEQDGISFATELRSEGNQTPVIYISKEEHRVFDSLVTRPISFVRKHHFFEDFKFALDLFFQNNIQEKEKPKLTCKTRYSGLITLEIRHITYIESYRNYQWVHLDNAEDHVEIVSTMDKLEEELGKYHFLRIHKSYLVNFQAIYRLSSSGVELEDGTVLAVSRRSFPIVRDAYVRLLREG